MRATAKNGGLTVRLALVGDGGEAAVAATRWWG